MDTSGQAEPPATLPFRQPLWILGLVVVVFCVATAGGIFGVTTSLSRLLPPEFVASGIGSGLLVLLADAVLIAACGYFLVGPIKQHLTVFTEGGMRQPGLRGPATIRWSEITAVKQSDFKVTFTAGRQSITLNYLLFADGSEVFRQIMQRLPQSTRVRRDAGH
jgi:hypothetical protein